MNRLSFLMFFLSSFASISSQSVHICQGMKDNNWKIDYTLNVPNGTFNRKFVVIKNNYWELQYNSKNDNSFSRSKRQNSNDSGGETASEVYLKDLWSKSSEWLSGDYQLAFAIRHGHPESEQWVNSTLGLLNTNTQTIDWSLFDRNFGDLSEGSAKESLPSNFSDFKPQTVYNTYSRQERNTAVFFEQTPTGKTNPKFKTRIQAYYSTDLKLGFTNETKDIDQPLPGRPVVPKALQKITTFYRIRGLFGVLIPSKAKNGTVILIEYCTSSVNTALGGCNSTFNYNYCIAEENDEDPMQKGCNPAKVDLQKLVDCSTSTDWTTTRGPTDKPIEPTAQSDQSPDDSNVGKTENNDNSGTDSEQNVGSTAQSGVKDEESGGLPWIVILIVIIIIIVIILVAVYLLCLKGKSKDGAQNEEAKPSDGASTSMGTTPDQNVKGPPSALRQPSTENTLSVPSIRSSIN